MDATYKYLSSLTASNQMCTIRVRIPRIWAAINTDTNEKFKLHMQLLDEKVEEMLGTSNKKDMDRISSSIIEGHIYDISGFVVKAAAPTYQAITGKNYVEFFEGTTFTEVTQCKEIIPMHRFGIVDYGSIISRVGSLGSLTDVCGLLIVISDIRYTKHQKSGRQTYLKEIKLLLECENEIVATLWGEKADLLTDEIISKCTDPTTVVLTSFLMKKDFTNEHPVKLSSTSATKIYLNLDVPECKQLLNRLAGKDKSSKITQSMPFVSPSNLGTELNIASLLTTLQSETCVGVKFFFKGEIMSVDDVFGWSYLSCKKCKGAAQKYGATYWCSKCASCIDEPQSRYKLLLNVRDNTASIKIIAFDQGAEKLLNHSVEELTQITTQDMGNDEVKDIFKKLSGQRYIFYVKPTYYDFRKGGKSLAANKILISSDTNSNNVKEKNILIEGQTSNKRLSEEISAASEGSALKRKRKTKT